jgi:hypothetical protein
VLKIIEEGKYALDDIYNCDETGLFFRCMPDKTLVLQSEQKTASGVRKSKERVTILCCVNASGSDKRQLVMVGKSASPKALKEYKNLSLTYKSQPSAWMSVEIFTDWLKNFDAAMGAAKRKILLLLDNAPVHPRDVKLDNIQLVFLEPNTTSKLQPLDSGIIKTLKTHYRSMVVMKVISEFDKTRKSLGGDAANPRALQESVSATKVINLGVAASFITGAWRKVTPECVKNCWLATGILPPSANLPASTPRSIDDADAVAVVGSNCDGDSPAVVDEEQRCLETLTNALSKLQQANPGMKVASAAQYAAVDDAAVVSCAMDPINPTDLDALLHSAIEKRGHVSDGEDDDNDNIGNVSDAEQEDDEVEDLTRPSPAPVAPRDRLSAPAAARMLEELLPWVAQLNAGPKGKAYVDFVHDLLAIAQRQVLESAKQTTILDFFAPKK